MVSQKYSILCEQAQYLLVENEEAICETVKLKVYGS